MMPPIHKNAKGNTKNYFGAIWSIGDLVAILKVIYLDVRFQDRGDLVEKVPSPF
jgi:hypothetical protein